MTRDNVLRFEASNRQLDHEIAVRELHSIADEILAELEVERVASGDVGTTGGDGEMAFSNKLTPAQTERLALALEEMGEAQQAIGKILRHGYDSYHPSGEGGDNRDQLIDELAHVRFAIQLLIDAGDVDGDFMEAAEGAKRASVAQYLHHQREVLK